MADFSKTVGRLTLKVERAVGIVDDCVSLTRAADFNGYTQPVRMTLDELRDLQYLVNRSIEQMGGV